jgi:uncharacterized protein
MNSDEKSACCCAVPLGRQDCSSATVTPTPPLSRYVLLGLAGLAVWWLIYRSLAVVAPWFTYSLLALPRGGHLSATIEFFVYESPKVLMLLTLVVFGVGIVRSFFTPERTRRILSGRRESVGNVLAALLGIVTPFCSCSAVPLFIGFVTTGVPLGVTFSFLVSAPMVNEVALVLLFGLFGWRVAGLYLGTGLLIAMISGWVIGRLRMERHVEDWVFQTQSGDAAPETKPDWLGRIRLGLDAVKDIVGRVWLYVLIGIGVGAGIHGYVPENFMASIMGKGAALGTVLAFMMSVIALSFPEAIILRKVLKPRLIVTFFGVVAVGIMIVGFLFNLIM